MAVELPDSDESSTADDDCVDGDFFSLWRLCGCCVSVPQSGPFDSLVGDLNRAFKVKEPEDAIGTLETFRDALLQPLTDPLPPWNGAVQPGGHPSAMVGYQQKRLMLTPLSFRSAIPSIIDIFREFRSSDDLDAAHVRRTFAEFSHRFLDEAGWLEIAEAFSQHTDGIWVGALGMSFYRLILARLSSMTTREETVVYNADEVIDVNETQVNETLLEMPLAHLFVLLLENYNGTAEQQLEVEALLKNREERYQVMGWGRNDAVVHH
ncbi:MAG: hypothetical protein KVP17_004441 [Porospora cf. gigantea B]|uniref:uncharacterized protein n=1 Tax=Porospora cf. gigantea B TaxID=2853592 RepID=UPI0035719E82|nr:MAG: hypothetical protein KVP17_004441 [Porospora cf. gigantea B]